MHKIDFKKYKRLFEVDDAGHIIEDIYGNVYRDMGVLVVKIDNRIGIYLDKESIKKTNFEGLKLYTTDERLKYKKEFEDFINTFDKNYILIDKFKLEEACSKIIEFLHLYKYTEFFYTDLLDPFEKSDTHIEAMKMLSDLKTRGRELLNHIFLEEKGYLNTILNSLSAKHGISREEIFDYKISELIDIPDGIKLDKNILDSRRNNHYTLMSRGENVCSLNISEIINYDLNGTENPNILKGSTANLGIYSGKARVIEPDYSNFKCLQKVLKNMQKGEVLVAESTSPEITVACKLAGAIVTNQGGILSHAAIISRELKIPCIVGTGNATKKINTGDYITVDGHSGEIIIKR